MNPHIQFCYSVLLICVGFFFPAIEFAVQPKDVLTILGGNGEFTVQTSPPAKTYTWHFKDKPITSENTDYGGCKTDKLFISKCLPKHVGVYMCVVTDESGEAFTSEKGTLKLGELKCYYHVS